MPRHSVTIDQWFARQDKAVEAASHRMNRWKVRNVKAPTTRKEKYIADLAMAAAAGKSLHTYPRDEQHAVFEFLKRAGIRIPRSATRPPAETRAVLEAQVEKRLKEEAAALIRAIATARAIYRLTAKGDNDYGKKIVTSPGGFLPSWVEQRAKYAGVSLELDEEDIPGYDLAFNNYTEILRKELMKEVGLA